MPRWVPPARAAIAAAALLLSFAQPGVFAAPAIHPVERERITLRIRPISAELVGDAVGPLVLDVDEEKGGELELAVRWPDGQSSRRLRLRARRGLSDYGSRVRLEAEMLDDAGAVLSRAAREMLFSGETATALFEVARRGDRVLTLAVEAERALEVGFSAYPVIGAPVQFRVEIQWVERGEPVTLETNVLNSFIGQPVSYAFRLGATGEAEALSLRLNPARLVGDTLRIEVEVSGTLPDADGEVTVVGRTEQWISSPDALSTLSLAEGDPPTGFRFLVTPRF